MSIIEIRSSRTGFGKYSINITDGIEFINFNFIPHLIASIFIKSQALGKIQKHKFQSRISVYSLVDRPSAFTMDQPTANAKTPLGGPMSQDSASERSRDPLEWHLKYFLNLYVISMILCGQENDNYRSIGCRVMGEYCIDRSIRGRVMGECWKLNEPLRHQFLNQWFEFRDVHKRDYFQIWKQQTRNEEEYRAYARDFVTMVRTNGNYRPS